YYRGAALVGLRESAAATPELRYVLAAEAPEWLRGRAHTELGKLADLAGDRDRATNEYRTAERICRARQDADGADEAAGLIRKRYR
ncbi:MAG: hypothetical protein ABJC89_13330, partial [Acidobacteriota bacterium]